ncbi:MAG: hypothetical protein GY842_01100 [bacterium]|nr:hypothetical protein [bacterium]
MRRLHLGEITCIAVALVSGQLGCPGAVAPSGGGRSGGGQPDPNDSTSPPTHAFLLDVARHVDEPFTEAEVDALFAEASRLLQTAQPECPDVATGVSFLRNATLDVFHGGSAVVTTEADLDALFDLPYDIKIVRGLVGVCGVEIPEDVATILGCATFGGSLVITSMAPADVWAHEWGHVQYLEHRDDCARNLMHSYELDTNAVNTTESQAFLTPTPGGPALRIGAGVPTRQPPTHLLRRIDEPADGWLNRVLRRRYSAGVPYELAVGGDADAVSGFASWCSMDTAPQARCNAVRLTGLAGDERACAALIELITTPVGGLDDDAFAVVSEAFLALGRLAERDPTGETLAFLISGTQPEWWADRGIRWRFAGYSGEGLHRLLARLSILGLGLSGCDASLDHLHMLQGRVDAGLLDAEVFGSQIDEAIARLERRPVIVRADDAARRWR